MSTRAVWRVPCVLGDELLKASERHLVSVQHERCNDRGARSRAERRAAERKGTASDGLERATVISGVAAQVLHSAAAGLRAATRAGPGVAGATNTVERTERVRAHGMIVVTVVAAKRAFIDVSAGRAVAGVALFAGATKRAHRIRAQRLGVAVVRGSRALVDISARGAAAGIAKLTNAGIGAYGVGAQRMRITIVGALGAFVRVAARDAIAREAVLTSARK